MLQKTLCRPPEETSLCLMVEGPRPRCMAAFVALAGGGWSHLEAVGSQKGGGSRKGPCGKDREASDGVQMTILQSNRANGGFQGPGLQLGLCLPRDSGPANSGLPSLTACQMAE